MKQYTPKELETENPEILNSVMNAAKMVLPSIRSHVERTLADQRFGMIAEHAQFVRITNDEETLFVEMRIHFLKLPVGIDGFLKKIILHDSLETYENERQKLTIESQKKFGDIGTTEFGGKLVGVIDRSEN